MAASTVTAARGLTSTGTNSILLLVGLGRCAKAPAPPLQPLRRDPRLAPKRRAREAARLECRERRAPVRLAPVPTRRELSQLRQAHPADPIRLRHGHLRGGACLDAVRLDRCGSPDGYRVKPAADEAAGHDDGDSAAGLALVAPDEDRGQRRRAIDLDRAPLMPLAQAVAVQSQGPASRTARGVASRAAPRAHLVHRRRSRDPGLDAERCLYDSNVAPVTC